MVVVGVVIVLGGGGVVSNPLRYPADHIRKGLLREHPLGSRSADVQAWLDAQQWRDRAHHEQVGLYWQDPGRRPEVIGSKSLAAHLGHYQGFPWRVNVEAFWAFDDQDRLIEVKVRKSADSL